MEQVLPELRDEEWRMGESQSDELRDAFEITGKRVLKMKSKKDVRIRNLPVSQIG